MNRKQLILILVFLVLIGGAGLILINRNRESWAQPEAKMGDKVLPGFDPNQVGAIHIRDAGSEVHLARKGDLWRVAEREDYPANFHQISDVLIKLKELKVVEADAVEPSDLARVDLIEPGKGGRGILAEFLDAQGKVIAALLIGKKQMKARDESSRAPVFTDTPTGCYVRLPDDQKDVLVISDPLSSLQPDPAAWLSRDFFKVEKPKSIALASTNSGDSWKLTRESETAAWTLADARAGEILDTSKLSPVVNAATSPRFTDIVMSNASVTTGLDKPNVVTLETFEGFTYTLKIGDKSPDGNDYMTVAVAAALPSDDKAAKLRDKLKQEQSLAPWTFQVGSWILDPLTRRRAMLLQGSDDGQAQQKPASIPDTSWHPHVIQ